MTATLTDFESALLKQILDGDEPNLCLLRMQLAHSSISRELTAVDFYIDFDVPENCPTISIGSCHIGGGGADIDGLVYGAGFVLFLSEGKLRTLAAYFYDEPRPEEIEECVFKYPCSSQRTLPC